MEAGNQPKISPAKPTASPQTTLAAGRTLPLRAGDIQLYRFSDDLTEALIYFMVVFGPWAFGTTQQWSIWTMNAAGYLLGALLAAKMFVRKVKGYQAGRWDNTTPPGNRVTVALGAVTILLLLYCLAGTLNYRAIYNPALLSFDYHTFVSWLPSTFDRDKSLQAFWNYLALACSFWAVRDWLLGKSEAESRPQVYPGGTGARAVHLLPERLRRLLWVIAINGALLGLESIAQRLSGSGKLLFFVQPRVNPLGETQFGPFAYRANASQYFNLVWPVTLAFWWTLQRGGRRGARVNLLLICGVVIAACPIISTSRGGALVTVAIVVLAAILLPASHFVLVERSSSKNQTKLIAPILLGCLMLALALGYALGGKALAPRMAQMQEGFEGREQMYAAARPMAKDYALFGTGPGAFESVFSLYRVSTATYWPAQLHNDWLETRITFGWLGSALSAAAGLLVLVRWFLSGGIHAGRRFMILMWLSVGGCLLHARYDFPFQIYSIVFLFLVLCAVLFSVSRKS